MHPRLNQPSYPETLEIYCVQYAMSSGKINIAGAPRGMVGTGFSVSATGILAKMHGERKNFLVARCN